LGEINKIAVIGVGEIGHQIAQEFAMSGYNVNINDSTEEKLEEANKKIQRNLEILVENGFIKRKQVKPTMKRINPYTSMVESTEDVDLVVEAVYENLELKQKIFKQLDQICKEKTILASNSSTIMPSYMASVTMRPDKVLVAHYINPPFLLPVVELVRSEETSDETVNIMYTLYKEMGKSPVVVEKEVPGFISNRIQAAVAREAMYLVEQGVASPDDVDKVIKDSIGRRWSSIGVFEWADLIAGLDLLVAGLPYVFPYLNSSPDLPQILQDKTERGELGVKTLKGFYSWTDREVEELRKRLFNNLVKISKWYNPKPSDNLK
jgi:3-hydroxybutyryl-CoA dehydrogenase